MYDKYIVRFCIAATILFVVFSVFLIILIVYMRGRLNTFYLEKQRLLTDNRTEMIAEYERIGNKVAKDLHDNILQVIYVLRFHLNGHLIKGNADHDAFTYADQLTIQLIDECNKICTGLNNDFILSNSLSTIIGFDMEKLCKAKNIGYHYKEKGKVKLLNPHFKGPIFRIAIEAIENAVKHAAANNIWVTVNFQDHSLLLKIKDDGCGFSSDKLHTKETIGLPYMYQRAKFLKGELTIDSIPGLGSTVILNCPC